MAETITLASFNMDTDRLEKSLSSLQDKFFDLKKAQKEYSDESKNTQKQIDNLKGAQDLLSKSAGDNTDAMAKNEAEIVALTNKQKDLFKSEQTLGVQMGTTRKEITQTTNQLKTYQDAENKTTSLIDLGNAAMQKQINNKNDARAANIALNNIVNQLNPAIDSEKKAIVDLNAQMDKNTAFIKGNSSETANQKMNIGNYQSATEGLSSALSSQGGIYNTVRTQVQGFRAGVTGAIDTVKGLQAGVVNAATNIMGFSNASKIAATQTATLATGNTAAAAATEGLAVAEGTATVASGGLASILGVLLSPITAVLAVGLLLYSVFKDFAPVVNPIKDAFAALGSVFTVVKTAILDLVTGAKSVGDIFSSFGSKVATAATETYRLEGATRALNKAMDIQELASARTATKVKELILQSKDLAKTHEERIAIINQAQKLEEGEFQNRFKNYKKEKEDLIDKLAVGKSISDEDKQRLREGDYEFLKSIAKKKKLDVELVEAYKKNQLSRESLMQEDNQIQEKAQNYKNKIIEKNQAAEDKANEASKAKREKAIEENKKADEKQKADDLKAILDKSKQEIDLFVSQQGFKKKSSKEEYEFNNALKEKELADLQLQFDKGKISKTQFETEKNNITNEFAKKNVDLVIANAQLEIDAATKKNNKILENSQFLSDEQLRIKKEALANQLIADDNFARLQFEKKLINQEELDKKLAENKETNRLASEQLDIDRLAAKQGADLAALDLKKQSDEVAFSVNLADQLAKFDIETVELRKAEIARGISEQQFDQERAKQKKELETQIFNNKLKLASDAFGQLSSIFGAESAAGKASAIAQTTIDTYLSAQKAYSSLAGIPIYGPVLGAIAAAAAISGGLANVKKITATKSPEIKMPSYAGGVIGLRGIGSGTSDNISANLSAGETVINARSTAMFANELSAISQAGGGVGLNGASNIGIQNDIQSRSDSSQMAETIANAVRLGAEAGTSSGSQKGLVSLSDNRKVMADAKF